MSTQQRHILSVLVENKPGVLSRVTGLVSRRGFNIESLSISALVSFRWPNRRPNTFPFDDHHDRRRCRIRTDHQAAA